MPGTFSAGLMSPTDMAVETRVGTMRVSVVIPTLNEASNAGELLRRVTANLGPADEVIFVDDGTDDLPHVVEKESERYAQSITVLRRTTRDGGLGGAVLAGLHLAQGDFAIICDGDLQHPPEVIPTMAAALEHADVVVASRYCLGGSAEGLSSGWRRVASRSTGVLSRLLYPMKLRGVTDPMSGFFAFRRNAVDLSSLRPRGFKILLEMLVRSPQLRVAEVPFTFADRINGASHATYNEGVRFLRQLLSARFLNKATAFMAIGLSGVIPNLAILWLLTHRGTHYVPAAAVATQLAIVWNFIGAELLVWRDHRAGDWQKRFAKFALIGETDLVRLPFVVALVTYLHLNSVLASALSLLGAFVCRFTLADKLVYRRKSTPALVSAKSIELSLTRSPTAPVPDSTTISPARPDDDPMREPAATGQAI
jgi:dolichol-phosphate mannosyltransferase